MSDLRPVRHGALDEFIAGRVREMIVNLTLAPGAKVDERQLCDDLNVSRTPFREAMRVLAAEGLVQITPRRGVRVVTVTEADLAETFPILGALEALAAETAALRITEDDLQALRYLQARMTDAHDGGDLDEYFRLNEAIHARIREAGGNASLVTMIDGFSTRIRRARYMANLSPARWGAAVEEHQAILSALEQRDAVQAGALMRTHLANKHAALVAALRKAGRLDDSSAA